MHEERLPDGLTNPQIVTWLQQRFDFSETDLLANRHGEFTSRQRARLEQHRFPRVLTAIAAGLALFAGWVAAGEKRRSSADFRRSRDLEPFPFDWTSGFVAVVVTLAVLLLPALGIWWHVTRWPLRRGPKSRTGPVHCYRQLHRYGRSVPAVGIGRGLKGRWFQVEPDDHKLFAQIPAATLYYTQGYGRTAVFSIDPHFD